MSDSPLRSPRAAQLVAAHDLIIACAAEAQAAAPELAADLMAHARRLCDSRCRPALAEALPTFTAGQLAEIKRNTAALYLLEKDALPFQPFELPAVTTGASSRLGLLSWPVPAGAIEDEVGDFFEVTSAVDTLFVVGRQRTAAGAARLMRAFALAVELVVARMVENTPPPVPAAFPMNRREVKQQLETRAQRTARRLAA